MLFSFASCGTEEKRNGTHVEQGCSLDIWFHNLIPFVSLTEKCSPFYDT